MKLHLGAFDQILPGWINTDITPHLCLARVPGLARILSAAGLLKQERASQHRAGVFRQLRRLDVTRRFPFPDNSVDAVYISHMLGSLRPEDGRRCISECHRVLKPGGVLRVAVVDLDEAIRAYRPERADEFVDLMFCLGTSRRAKNRNWWHYNESSLRARFAEAGFQDVSRRDFGEGRCPDVAVIESRPGSLFMEAVK